jgi:hypothetical protein
MKVLCPVMTTQFGGVNCKGERCAWWSEGQCAVRGLTGKGPVEEGMVEVPVVEEEKRGEAIKMPETVDVPVSKETV